MRADARRQTLRGGPSTQHARPGRAAFTLLEILLAIALIGLISAALVTISIRLTDQKPATPEAVFWEAVNEARKSALKHEQEMRLSFDDKDKKFTLDPGGKTFELPGAPRDLTVEFLLAQSDGSGSVLIGGQLVDTKTVPSVTFYADGTCSPFRLQIRSGGPAKLVSIDPWTCARVLQPAEGNP